MLYTHSVTDDWDVYVVNEVRDWINQLDAVTHARVVAAIDLLAEAGPGLGRPLVDTIHGSTVVNPEGAAAGHGGHPVRVRPVAFHDPAGGGRQGGAVV